MTRTLPVPCPSGCFGCRQSPMSELTMSKADREAFLADAHVGVVGIQREGAPPLTAPVWYSYEAGGDVVFAFEAESEKIRLLRAVGEASLCAQTETMPYR